MLPDDNELAGPSKIKRIVREADDEELDDYMKVRLYFYMPEKALRNKLFTQEWFIVAQDSMDEPDELKLTGIPFIDVSQTTLNQLAVRDLGAVQDR